MIAIIAMFFLFAMISFVTNLAAPLGTIWKNNYDWSGMLGNMMNFLAYLFMGIPAGNLLVSIGYKKTALYAIVVGLIGLALQWLSGLVGTETGVFSIGDDVVTLNFIIYLLGAFTCGFCVCMLNTVVNPMLNLLGGGGNKGNQLVQTGGSLNSLAGTCTPLFVGMLIGEVTASTTMGAVAPLLFIAMGIFVLAFVIISAVAIPEPHMRKGGVEKKKYSHSPWNFRHTVLGVIAIFLYVGIEVGIPGVLIFYLTDVTGSVAVAGGVAAIYWLLMLVGRLVSSIISSKVSSRTQLITVSVAGIAFVCTAIFLSEGIKVSMPAYSAGDGFSMAQVGGNVPGTLRPLHIGDVGRHIQSRSRRSRQIHRKSFRHLHDDGGRRRRRTPGTECNRQQPRLHDILLARCGSARLYALLRPARFEECQHRHPC